MTTKCKRSLCAWQHNDIKFFSNIICWAMVLKKKTDKWTEHKGMQLCRCPWSLISLTNRKMHLKMPRESVWGCVRTVQSPTSHRAGRGRSKFSQCSSVMLWVTDIMHYPVNNAAEAQPATQLPPLAFPVLFSYRITLLQFVEEEQAVMCS